MTIAESSPGPDTHPPSSLVSVATATDAATTSLDVDLWPDGHALPSRVIEKSLSASELRVLYFP